MSNESIYKLIPALVVPEKKKKMYRSKHDGSLPPSGSTFGAGNFAGTSSGKKAKSFGASFGPRELNVHGSSGFLRKGDGKPTLADPKPFKYTDRRKGAVPRRTDKPFMGLVTTKNFVTSNAVDAMLSEPKKKATKSGPKKHAEHGKVPKYLRRVKNQVEGEYQSARSSLNSARDQHLADQPQLQLLPEEDRVRLLAQLKLKWENINKDYQQLTHITALDSIGKVRRKEKFEADLQQLEKDIERLSKPNVFIRTDS